MVPYQKTYLHWMLHRTELPSQKICETMSSKWNTRLTLTDYQHRHLHLEDFFGKEKGHLQWKTDGWKNQKKKMQSMVSWLIQILSSSGVDVGSNVFLFSEMEQPEVVPDPIQEGANQEQ